MKKRKPIDKYNYYKKDYAKYLLFVKDKDKLITFGIDAKIVSYLFKINYCEELILSKYLLDDLLVLKEKYHFNIAVIGPKIREYYCSEFSDYLRLKNKSKKYVKEVDCYGEE